jgi:hypothetical protein
VARLVRSIQGRAGAPLIGYVGGISTIRATPGLYDASAKFRNRAVCRSGRSQKGRCEAGCHVSCRMNHIVDTDRWALDDAGTYNG